MKRYIKSSNEPKQYYSITFLDDYATSHCNLVFTDDIDKIPTHYKKDGYLVISIDTANNYDIEEAKRKHMPIIEL